MKRSIIPVLFACFLLPALAFSQETVAKKWSLSVGYYGETVTHPGLKVGLRYTIFENAYSAFMVEANLTGFWHPLNSVALSIDLQPGYRLTLPSGLFFDVFAGIGYMHRFLDSPTFQVQSGAVKPYNHLGFPELMIPASLGIGWDFARSTARPFDVALRIGGFGEYPVNHITILQPAFQLAASFPVF